MDPAFILPKDLQLGLRLLVHVQDMNNEIQDAMSQNYALPNEIDEDELMGELDGLEDDLAAELDTGAGGVPSYLQVNGCPSSSSGQASRLWHL